MADDPRIDPADLRNVRFPGSSRRYDARSVDQFLETVASRVAATNVLVDELRRELADARAATPAAVASPAPSDLSLLDDEDLVRLVGAETASVLATARRAAEEIRSKAEEAAARLIREATAEADQVTEAATRRAAELTSGAEEALARATTEAEEAATRIRSEAADEAERLREQQRRAAEEESAAMEARRAEAEAEAQAVVEQAREEGRAMVAEAREVRARILDDLQRRRDAARDQVERLLAGRERLLAAYALVRENLDDITGQLADALPEPEEPQLPDGFAGIVGSALPPSTSSAAVDTDLASAAGGDDPPADVVVLAGGDIDDTDPAASASAAAGADDATGQRDGRPESLGDIDDTVAPATGREATGAGLAGPSPELGSAGSEVAVERVEADAGSEVAVERVEADAGSEVAVDGVEADAGSEVAVDGDEADAGSATPAGRIEAGSEPEGDRQPDEPAGPDEEPALPPAIAEEDPPVEEAAGLGEPVLPADPDEPVEAAEPSPLPGDVDALFARLRAEREASVAQAQEVLAEAADDVPGGGPPEPTADGPEEEPATPAGSPPPTPASAGSGPVDGGRVGPEPGAVTIDAGPSDADPADADPRTAEAGAETSDAAAVGTAAGPVVDLDRVPAELLADPEALARRAESLAPVTAALNRALKRRLADEQNQVLDELRRRAATDPDELLPAADGQVAGYARVAARHLATAAAAGGAEAPEATDELALALARTLVEPFRRRVERAAADVDDADELDERLRALYREWKVQHVGPAAEDALLSAYAEGTLAGAAGGAVRWRIDPDQGPCPDAQDNALAGSLGAGEPFPTGDRCPQAHPGCRCLLVVDAT